MAPSSLPLICPGIRALLLPAAAAAWTTGTVKLPYSMAVTRGRMGFHAEAFLPGHGLVRGAGPVGRFYLGWEIPLRGVDLSCRAGREDLHRLQNQSFIGRVQRD